MIAGQRLWRTRDGGLVPDGDQAAVTLAYAPGDEVSPADQALMPTAEKAQSAPAAKVQRTARGKAARS